MPSFILSNRFRQRCGIVAVMLLASCSVPTAVEDSPGTTSPPGTLPPSGTNPPPGTDSPTNADPPYWTMGYHPWWLGSSWTEYELSVIRKLLFFDVSVGADGTITDRNGWPDTWRQMKQAVQRSGGYVLPTISLFESDAFTSIFSGGSGVDVLRTELLNLVDETAVDGLHLDFEIFERISSTARNGFVDFVRDLRADMDTRPRRLFLTAFTLAANHHDNYDERALSEHVDYLVVQGYDYHWIEGSHAGPISPLEGWGKLNWHTVLDRYLKLGVPRNKIVMTVPYYGFEWPTETDAPGSRTRGPGQFTTYAPLPPSVTDAPPPSSREQAARFGLKRDSQSGSPYYAFTDSTGWYQGWFEDAESLREKYEFIRQEGLAGVAIWPLGYGDETLTQVLRDVFPPTSVTTSIEK